jgi:DNA invertase Pin-like site-specific DNA recombinase
MSAISYCGDVIRSKGRHFSEVELSRIQLLLHQSEMSVSEIAERMRCSRSAVVSINRKFQIRLYSGHRTTWSVNRGAAEASKNSD